MEQTRQAGLLLSVTSLPGKYGIGDFGASAFTFIDLIKSAGFGLWQILPLNPLGYGNSPYQPYSSFAIDEQFADLDELLEMGLLDEIEEVKPLENKVRYDEVKAFKMKYLRLAFERFIKRKGAKEELDAFEQAHPWAKDWSVFMMYKRAYPSSWNAWPEEIKGWIKTRPALPEKEEHERQFETFIQLVLYRQWDKIHAYAKLKGIKIIGDVPFYVGYDSVDVWANQQVFLLNKETLEPDFIAGVPPDYFSATGQRWGNPIYDWDYLEKTDFFFIENRIHLNAALYDIIRLDHFRAFDTYWSIPSSCPTAIDGKWIEAPGYKLFDSLFAKYPDLSIIAEDLGDLRPEVLELRDHYNFPGMNVIQFTFHDCELVHKGDWNRVNSVAYLDTHDNDTMLSYFYLLPEQEQGEWLAALGKMGIVLGPVVDRMITYCMRKPANMAILSMQDILGLDGIARTNVPGIVDDRNWTWKMADFEAFKQRLGFLKDLIVSTGRFHG